MKQFIVRFDERNAINVRAVDATEAKNEACAQAWLLTGKWSEIQSVEELKGEQKS